MGKINEEKRQKKLEREERRNQELEQTKKEIEQLINNINEMTGDDQKISMVDFKIPTKKERIINALIKNGLSFAIILSLTGFFNWLYYDTFMAVLGFGLSVIVLENILNFLMVYFFGKYVIYSFGTINVLPPIFSFVITAMVYPFAEPVSVLLLVIVMALYIIIRKVMLGLLKGGKRKPVIGRK